MKLTTLKDMEPWDWPPDAADTFLQVLRDPQAGEEDRLIAANLAGDIVAVNDALVEALLAILRSSHESENLRGTAAISLGPILEQAEIFEFEDPDDVPISEQTFQTIRSALSILYADAQVPNGVRRKILEASVRAPQEWHQDAIRAAYAGSDEEWKVTAVSCMRFVRGFDQEILASLESPNPEVRYEAVCAAGDWELDSAFPLIAELFSSDETDKALLLAAIEAAATIRPDEITPLLSELLESDDEEIVDAVDEALAIADALLHAEEEDDEDDGAGKLRH